MAKLATRITYNGLLVALLTVCLFLARLRMLRLSALLAASLIVVCSLILQGFRQTTLIYLVATIIGILFLPSTATLLFVMFFGFYPLLKVWIEKQSHSWLAVWPLKIAYFLLVFFLSRYVLWFFLPSHWLFVSRVSVFFVPLAIIYDVGLTLIAPTLDRYLQIYRLR